MENGDPDPGGKIRRKLANKKTNNFHVNFVICNKFFFSSADFSAWIRISIEAEADLGSESAIQRMRIHIAGLNSAGLEQSFRNSK